LHCSSGACPVLARPVRSVGRPRILSLSVPILIGIAAVCGVAAAGNAQSSPKLTFKKVLEGSTPEYLEICVDSNGAGTYDGRRLKDPAEIRTLKLSAATTERIFALAHSLNDFNSIDLESHKKVANMGRKTFVYESNGQTYTAEFNYSLRREAQELADLFEKISSVEEHIKALEFEEKYDHLQLPQELLQIRIDLDNKALADPELLAPTLRLIAHDSRYLHLAQARAQDILARLGESDSRSPER